MATARIVAVSTGVVEDLVIAGQPDHSAIDKRPAAGPVPVGSLGLAGDEHGDTQHHGGLDQALYAYAREDLDWWTERIGRELRNGGFGENVTTSGIDVSAALIGETWRVGEVVIQLTAPRIPCETFKAWIGEEHWVRRFAAAGRPGVYLRVLAGGELAAGDAIELVARPQPCVTVAESMRAYYGDAGLMTALLTVPGRAAKWDAIADRVLGRTVA